MEVAEPLPPSEGVWRQYLAGGERWNLCGQCPWESGKESWLTNSHCQARLAHSPNALLSCVAYATRMQYSSTQCCNTAYWTYPLDMYYCVLPNPPSVASQAGARLTSFPHHANPFMDIVDFADALGAVAKRVYGRAGDSPSGAGPSPHAPPPLASERGGRGRGTRSLAGALAKHASPAGTRKHSPPGSRKHSPPGARKHSPLGSRKHSPASGQLGTQAKPRTSEEGGHTGPSPAPIQLITRLLDAWGHCDTSAGQQQDHDNDESARQQAYGYQRWLEMGESAAREAVERAAAGARAGGRQPARPAPS